MKRWLYLLALLIGVGLLSRLPHPARDIAKLDPVRAVYIYMEGDRLCLETDTDAHGSGGDLTGALGDLRSNASREVFLETAEYLLLDPEVELTGDFYTILRPSCRVVLTRDRPDLATAAEYLSIHTPDMTLAHLRAGDP